MNDERVHGKTPYIYSDMFAHTITSTYGAKGAQWLEQLPILIERSAQQWQLTQLQPYSDLTYNYVLFGMMHGKQIVLKLRCDHEALRNEVMALIAFAQYGCVKVLAHDIAIGALVLERVVPGDLLVSLFPENDARATRLAGDLVGALHRAPAPSGHMFPQLKNVLPDLRHDSYALAKCIIRARTLRRQLLSSTHHEVLLHGDFHHGNILLDSNQQWVVIDPEGIIGDPLYDIAVYIRNPMQLLVNAPYADQIIKSRIDYFSRILDCSAQRIYDWTYLQAVSSAYWSVEDGLDVTNHRAFLAILDEISGD